MTDNPTPNDIALLREAAKALVDRFPKDWPDYSPCYDEVTALRAALAPGQHDGATGEGLTIPAGKMTRTLAYAFVGKLKQSQKADVSERLGIRLDYSLPALERDKRFLQAVVDAGAVNFLEAALASLLPMDFTPKPSTEQARAEGYVLVPRVPTAQMEQAGAGYIFEDGINYEARCESAKHVFSAMIAAATPSGADALGDRL